jgi:hypothetical protein
VFDSHLVLVLSGTSSSEVERWIADYYFMFLLSSYNFMKVSFFTKKRINCTSSSEVEGWIAVPIILCFYCLLIIFCRFLFSQKKLDGGLVKN